MSKRKVFVEDKIICCKSISGWKRKPTANCRYVWCKSRICPTMDSKLWIYGKRFTDRGTLVKMIEDYIDYYNNKRLQRNLGILTPMEKHEIYLQAA